MPPLPLALTFRALLPGLSSDSDAVLGALVASDGAAISGSTMARRVGLHSRYQLDRRLRRDGLPAFGELADWVSVLAVLWQVEAEGASLLNVAARARLGPATCYRRCRRRLGVPWREARVRGFAWGLTVFLQRCTRRAAPFALTGSSLETAWASPLRSASESPAGPRTAPHKQELTNPQGLVAYRIEVPDTPTDIAVSSTGVVYLTQAYGASIARLDLDQRRIGRPIKVGSNPTRLTFGPGRSAFVTNQFGGSVSVIDVPAESRILDIPVPGDPAPLAISPDGRTLYVATNHDTLYAISTNTRRVLRSLALPATSHHLALHPNGGRLYVSTRAAGTVMEVETPTLRERRTFETGGQTQALAVAPGGRELYVADEAGAVHVINLDTGMPAATVHVPGLPYGLDLTPDGTQLYVAIPSQGQVHILDRVTRRLVSTIATGGSPRHTAFVAGGSTALIVNEAGWVTVVW